MSIRAYAALALLAFAPFALADVKSDLLASHEAMVKAGKFRTVGTTTTPKDGSQPLWGEVQWPDRFHSRNPGGEFIMIPGKNYMKQQDGTWVALELDLSAMVKYLSPESIRQNVETLTNPKDLGESKLGEKTVHGYEYDTSAEIMGIRADSHVKVWIDTETKLVLKQETDNKAAGQTSQTMLRYEYDPAISIEAPL